MVDPALTTEALAHAPDHVGPRGRGARARWRRRSRRSWSDEVLEVARHPNADKLTVCKVDVGAGKPARDRLRRAERRGGHEGAGRARRRGATGRWRSSRRRAARRREPGDAVLGAGARPRRTITPGLLALPADAPVGRDVREVLGLDDQVLTLKLTPNRADCLSVLGVAREVAALTGARLTPPRDHGGSRRRSTRRFPVKISDAGGLRPLRRARDPQRQRRGADPGLDAAAPRARRTALDLGAGGRHQLRDARAGPAAARLRPRQARRAASTCASAAAGEQREAAERADGRRRRRTCCASPTPRGPIGLAGIMGGDQHQGRDLDTRNVFLESAFFFPDAIAGRARRYNFASDAAHRFERGVDFDNDVQGIERATAADPRDLRRRARARRSTPSRGCPSASPCACASRARRRSSASPSPADEMAGIFQRLGLAATRSGRGADEAFVVTPPSYRFDIEIEEDLIEEVARIHGFERIPAHPPRRAGGHARAAPRNGGRCTTLRDATRRGATTRRSSTSASSSRGLGARISRATRSRSGS